MYLRSSRLSLVLAALTLALPASLVAQQAAPQGTPTAAPQQAPLPPHGWRFDTGHSAVTFRVRHLGISWVNGRFNTWTGSLVYDPANPTAASVNVRIQTNSIDTESERRDNDIRSGNYLAVDSFPEMTFVSRKVEKVDDTHLKVTGDLTLRGVTREVVLATEVTGSMPGERTRRIAFTATTTIDRMAYGVSFNRLTEGAQVVGSEIRITIDIEATQPVAAAQ